MTGVIIAGSALVIFSAVINWKISAERAQKIMKIAILIWNLYICILVLYPNSNFLWPLEQNQADAVLFMLILLLLIVLIFATTILIPYAKNKTDVEVMQYTIKHSIIFAIFMTGILALFIWVVVAFSF
ncbi:MAG: hypothetical protein FWC75_06630 [Oscillospiraceae bacterium]|nr:hypothetical protein [Oscillospiraceae bacterium]